METWLFLKAALGLVCTFNLTFLANDLMHSDDHKELCNDASTLIISMTVPKIEEVIK